MLYNILRRERGGEGEGRGEREREREREGTCRRSRGGRGLIALCIVFIPSGTNNDSH